MGGNSEAQCPSACPSFLSLSVPSTVCMHPLSPKRACTHTHTQARTNTHTHTYAPALLGRLAADALDLLKCVQHVVLQQHADAEGGVAGAGVIDGDVGVNGLEDGLPAGWRCVCVHVHACACGKGVGMKGEWMGGSVGGREGCDAWVGLKKGSKIILKIFI